MAELSRIHGIARKTGYEWVGRYEIEGLSGLKDRRMERRFIRIGPTPASRSRFYS